MKINKDNIIKAMMDNQRAYHNHVVDKIDEMMPASDDEANNEMSKALLDSMTPKWVKAPIDSACPGCGKESLERSMHLMGGPWAGSVRCTEAECDYTSSVMSHLGKQMIKVEPLTIE